MSEKKKSKISNIPKPTYRADPRKLSAIPQKLKDSGTFCVWKFRPRKDKDGNVTGWTKPPYSPRADRTTGAKVNDPATFGSFDAALQLISGDNPTYAGIGIALYGNLCGVDIDHCKLPDGSYTEAAGEIIKTLEGTYMESSPSGNGLHIYCQLSCEAKAALKQCGNKSKPLDEYGTSLEIYSGINTLHYFTVTGERALDSPVIVADKTKELIGLTKKYLGKHPLNNGQKKRDATAPPQRATAPPQRRGRRIADEMVKEALLERDGRAERNRTLFKGGTVKDGDRSQDDATLAFALSYYTQDREQIRRIMLQSELAREKWHERRGGGDYLDLTINRMLDYRLDGVNKIFDWYPARDNLPRKIFDFLNKWQRKTFGSDFDLSQKYILVPSAAAFPQDRDKPKLNLIKVVHGDSKNPSRGLSHMLCEMERADPNNIRKPSIYTDHAGGILLTLTPNDRAKAATERYHLIPENPLVEVLQRNSTAYHSYDVAHKTFKGLPVLDEIDALLERHELKHFAKNAELSSQLLNGTEMHETCYPDGTVMPNVTGREWYVEASVFPSSVRNPHNLLLLSREEGGRKVFAAIHEGVLPDFESLEIGDTIEIGERGELDNLSWASQLEGISL